MINPILQRSLLAAHGYRCVYCGGRADTADHITSTFSGGKEDAGNLIAACQPCNSTKGNKRLNIKLETELRIKAWVATALVEQLVAASEAAEVTARARKKSPIDLTKLETFN
jgi:5-methylcytosine-specific restriction endonuclease McrA